MKAPFAAGARRPTLINLTYLLLLSVASCARASSPETFVADPSLQNDFTSNLPDTGSTGNLEYSIVQGLAILEGDILLGYVESDGSLANGLRARGVGKNDAFSRWPDGIVVYEAPVSHTQEQQDKVAEAINHWIDNTTLSFVERTDENADQYPHFIQFKDSQSCASHVGMIGGAQPIFISNACSVGSIIHEIGHAVGLFHEHTRADRDNFVQVDYNQIIDGKDINFKVQDVNTDTYSAYDYGSIMHYGEYFFSKSDLPTIIVNGDIKIGQREALSPMDIESVNRMYETDLALGPLATAITDEGLEVDITAYNYGTLGAHQLELLLRFNDNSEWLGVSSDSGWDCLTYDSELKCTRDTFIEQSESRFTAYSNTFSDTTNDLSVLLVAQTQDPNPSNNSLNNDGVEWQALGEQSGEASVAEQVDEAPSEDTQSLSASDAPALLAAKESSASNDSNPEISTASAGSAGLSMLAIMSIIGLRRRRQIAR